MKKRLPLCILRRLPHQSETRESRYVALTYTTARLDLSCPVSHSFQKLSAGAALPHPLLAAGGAAARSGHARLKALTRLLPADLRDWTVLRLVRAGYRDIHPLISELAAGVLYTLPPPDGVLYLIGDTTITGKTGRQQPLAHYTRLNQYQRFTFGLSLVLLIAQWGRLRVPVGATVLDPKKKGDQNIQFRQMLRPFQPPAWCRQVVVLADAGFASKDNLRLIRRRQWQYVFALPRTWKLTDGTHLRDLARHLPRSRYRRITSRTPDQRRKVYRVFLRRAELKLLGDVTILLSKRRRW